MLKHLMIILAFGYSLNSFACECNEKPPLDSAIKSSQLIAVGKIISVNRVKIIRDESVNGEFLDEYSPDSAKWKSSPFKSELYCYEVKLKKIYKGKKYQRVFIHSEIIGGACAYHFVIGRNYIIYATNNKVIKDGKTDQVLFTSSCTRTDVFSIKEEKAIIRYIRS